MKSTSSRCRHNCVMSGNSKKNKKSSRQKQAASLQYAGTARYQIVAFPELAGTFCCLNCPLCDVSLFSRCPNFHLPRHAIWVEGLNSVLSFDWRYEYCLCFAAGTSRLPAGFALGLGIVARLIDCLWCSVTIIKRVEECAGNVSVRSVDSLWECFESCGLRIRESACRLPDRARGNGIGVNAVMERHHMVAAELSCPGEALLFYRFERITLCVL